jgi:hypothetical protein
VSLARSISMRSVPNSPPQLPTDTLPIQDSLDLFPPLPAAYPASYINSPVQQHTPPTPQQQLYAHDDEAITYSSRLLIPRKGVEKFSQHQQYEKLDGRHMTQPPPTPSSSPVPMYRPRSASVSRKPPISSTPAVRPSKILTSSSDSSSRKIRQLFVEGIQLGTKINQSHVLADVDICFDSESDNATETTRPRRLLSKEDSKNVLLGTTSDEYEIADISSQSAYTPLSYAAYAQNMFNYGGIGGIPTPLTREILSFVERVDSYGAKMQRLVFSVCYV